MALDTGSTFPRVRTQGARAMMRVTLRPSGGRLYGVCSESLTCTFGAILGLIVRRRRRV